MPAPSIHLVSEITNTNEFWRQVFSEFAKSPPKKKWYQLWKPHSPETRLNNEINSVLDQENFQPFVRGFMLQAPQIKNQTIDCFISRFNNYKTNKELTIELLRQIEPLIGQEYMDVLFRDALTKLKNYETKLIILKQINQWQALQPKQIQTTLATIDREDQFQLIKASLGDPEAIEILSTAIYQFNTDLAFWERLEKTLPLHEDNKIVLSSMVKLINRLDQKLKIELLLKLKFRPYNDPLLMRSLFVLGDESLDDILALLDGVSSRQLTTLLKQTDKYNFNLISDAHCFYPEYIPHIKERMQQITDISFEMLGIPLDILHRSMKKRNILNLDNILSDIVNFHNLNYDFKFNLLKVTNESGQSPLMHALKLDDHDKALEYARQLLKNIRQLNREDQLQIISLVDDQNENLLFPIIKNFPELLDEVFDMIGQFEDIEQLMIFQQINKSKSSLVLYAAEHSSKAMELLSRDYFPLLSEQEKITLLNQRITVLSKINGRKIFGQATPLLKAILFQSQAVEILLNVIDNIASLDERKNLLKQRNTLILASSLNPDCLPYLLNSFEKLGDDEIFKNCLLEKNKKNETGLECLVSKTKGTYKTSIQAYLHQIKRLNLEEQREILKRAYEKAQHGQRESVLPIFKQLTSVRSELENPSLVSLSGLFAKKSDACVIEPFYDAVKQAASP